MMHRSPLLKHVVMRRRLWSGHRNAQRPGPGWRRAPSRLPQQRRRGAAISVKVEREDTRRSRRSRASRPRRSARRRCGRRSPSGGSPCSASEAARPGSAGAAWGPWGPWALLMGVEAAGLPLWQALRGGGTSPQIEAEEAGAPASLVYPAHGALLRMFYESPGPGRLRRAVRHCRDPKEQSGSTSTTSARK